MKIGKITQEHLDRLRDAGLSFGPSTTVGDLLKAVSPILVRGERVWLRFGMFADMKHVKVGYYGQFREQYVTEADSVADALVGFLVKLSIHEDGATVK